jgi:uncharacterized protein YqcC (DUF446 family)
VSGKHTAVGEILLDIECELRRLDLWQEDTPSEEALASEQPFALDSLDFHQWLQFILLPKMHHLVLHRLALPSACNMAPMAEQVYQDKTDLMTSLLTHLQKLDGVFRLTT